MTSSKSNLEPILQQLQQLIAKEEEYCLPNPLQHEQSTQLLKQLFDSIVQSSIHRFGPLETLIIEGFDEETIWEQLQTRNKPFLKYFQKKFLQWKKKIEKLQKKHKDDQQEKQLHQGEITGTDQESTSEEEEVEEEDYLKERDDDLENDDDDDDYDEQDEEEQQRFDDEMEEGEDDEEEEEEEVMEAIEERERKPNKKPSKRDIYEEELQMEAWLDAFEEMENKHRDKEEKLEKKEKRGKSNQYGAQWSDEEEDAAEEEEEEEDDDDLGFVQNAMYNTEEEEDSEEDEEAENLDPSKIKYNDFFADSDEQEDDEPHDRRKRKPQRKLSKKHQKEEEEEEAEEEFDQDDDAEEDGEEQEEEDGSIEDTRGKNLNQKKSSTFLTNYQRRQLELKQQIEELEKELLAEKSWEYKGEIKAAERPENSLLDITAEVERATKIAPIVTQEFTNTLEEMIIKRIKDQQFDDPNPRQRRAAIAEMKITDPGVDPAAEVSQEKNKLGLGEIYAQEYAEKFLNTEETNNIKTKQLQEEVINIFNHLSRQLNELSHFYFTPKPIVEESSAKVLATQRSLPAVEMEDITPFHTTSQADQAAPEQILEKKRGKKITLLTSEELTSNDRKKLRKHYKEINKADKAAKEAEERLLHPNQKSQLSDKQLHQELRGDKRVTLTSDKHHGGGKKKGGRGADHEDGAQQQGVGNAGSYSNSSNFFNFLQKETEQTIHNEKRKNDDNHLSSASSKKQKTTNTSSSSNYKL